MSRIPGRLGRIEVSGDAENTFFLLGCVVDATYNGNQDELDASCHESGQFREYISGRKDATIDATVHWDEADTGQSIVTDAYFSSTPISVKFRMQTGAGFREFISRGIITSYSMSSPNDDIADLDITIRVSGDFSASIQT